MIDVRARDKSGARNGLRFLLRGLSAALAILFITSCGNDLFIVGTPVITITAQRGQFTSYIVTIDQINMTRLDGTVIELPTINQRVDLAQLQDFTYLLEAPPIGEGTYVSATFFLDYASSEVTIDVDGQAGPTNLIDGITGVTPGTQQITVNFDPAKPLVIGNSVASLVNFNIDLEASNTIANNGLPSTVTVHPVFTLTADPVYEKPVYTRGLFVFADTNQGNFVMNSRPLHDVIDTPYGAVTVIPSATTYYNINGVTYVGAAGLAQLSALKAQTAVLQIATVATPGNPWGNLTGGGDTPPTLTAAEVYAGTSLESTIQDRITGIVAARSGDTLTIMGASLVDRLGDFGFTQAIPVTLAPITNGTSTTVVSVDGVANPSPAPTVDTISVGQYVEISGQVNPADASNDYLNPDGTFNPTGLDATDGQVRIKPTTMLATVQSGTTGSALVSLDYVQRYEPTYLDFTGVGAGTTASNYTINTGSTDESGATPGVTQLKIVGVTNAYGSGPPDFTATSVTPVSSVPQKLIIEYSADGSPDPFVSVTAAGLYVNLQDANLLGGAVHVIRTGPQGDPAYNVDITTLPNPLLIVPAVNPNDALQNLFAVGNVPNNVAVFSSPAAFATSVLYYLGAVGPITKVVATGQYDGAGHFVATNIEVVVH